MELPNSEGHETLVMGGGGRERELDITITIPFRDIYDRFTHYSTLVRLSPNSIFKDEKTEAQRC